MVSSVCVFLLVSMDFCLETGLLDLCLRMEMELNLDNVKFVEELEFPLRRIPNNFFY